jgi:alkylation response protein AidB-like acyl-CoA dehydrogenase
MTTGQRLRGAAAPGRPAGSNGSTAPAAALIQLITVDGIRRAISPVLLRLADSAAERESHRELPFAEMRELAGLGLLTLRVRREDGGAGGSLRDLAEMVIEIARADSNVAQALRPSVLAADRLAAAEEDPRRAKLLARVLRGDLFSGTVNERAGASGAVGTTITPEGDGFVINGSKYYSTGGLYADWFSGTATDETGAVVFFTVPTDRDGVETVDDFDAVGQRLTASGTTRLDGVRVAADEVESAARRRRVPFNPLPQLYLASVQAGIAAAVLDDAVTFARDTARPIKHSTAQRAVDDPYVRHVVGEISARRLAARAAVILAAETLDAATSGAYDRATLAAASITVAEAQFIAVESALKAAELLFDVGGGSATDRQYNLDRHWRNARTVANHNPRAWKAAVVGGYRLADEEPPATGLF